MSAADRRQVALDRARIDRGIKDARPVYGRCDLAFLIAIDDLRDIACELCDRSGNRQDDRRWTILTTLAAVERGVLNPTQILKVIRG